MRTVLKYILLLFLASFAGHSTARADIIIDGDAAFTKQVEDCLNRLLETGGQTATIVQGLESSARNHVIRQSNRTNRTDPDNERDANSVAAGGSGTGTGSTVNWDPTYRDPYQDGTARDPCASLLHELQHSTEINNGTGDLRPDPATGIPNEEIRCCREENRYRNATRPRLPQRTQYGPNRLPADARFP